MKNFIQNSYFFKTSLLTLKIYCFTELFKSYLIDVQLSYGISMIPTIESSGTWLFHEPLSIRKGLINEVTDNQNASSYTILNEFYSGLRRGDLVVALSPDDPSKSVCKRIIGFPNDIIYEDYLNHSHKIKIPSNHVWLEGDNLNNSKDSRIYGPVNIKLIKGKVFAKVSVSLKIIEYLLMCCLFILQIFTVK